MEKSICPRPPIGGASIALLISFLSLPAAAIGGEAAPVSPAETPAEARPAAASIATPAGAAPEPPASAVEPSDQPEKFSDLPEKFSLRLGGGFLFNSGTTVGLGGELAQLEIGWETTLGGDEEAFFYRVDAAYRFTPRHALTLTHYGVDRSGSKVLERDVQIGDTTYPVGVKMDTEFFFNITRLYYTYSFYRSREVELGLNAGFYFGYLGLSASALGVGGSLDRSVEASETLLVPVPSFGLSMRYNILPRLQAFAGFDWFYLDVGDWRGSLVEIIFGLEYRAFDHIGLGAAIDRLSITVDGTFTTSGRDESASVDSDWNVALFYLAFYL